MIVSGFMSNIAAKSTHDHELPVAWGASGPPTSGRSCVTSMIDIGFSAPKQMSINVADPWKTLSVGDHAESTGDTPYRALLCA
jgi:hypothetical protein